jgi:hypothetical protein
MAPCAGIFLVVEMGYKENCTSIELEEEQVAESFR